MELRPRPFPFKLVFGAMLGLPALGLVMTVMDTGSSWTDLVTAFRQEFAGDTGALIESGLIFLAMIGTAWGTLVFQRHARVSVDQDRIAFRSGLPGFCRWLMPDWQFDYADIGAFALRPVGRGNFLTLVIKPEQGRTRRLLPEQWVEPGGHAKMMNWFRISRASSEDAKRLLQETPLLRQLQAAGVPIDISLQHYRPGLNSADQFDLKSNKTTLGCLLLMAALGLYALVDGVLLPGDRYAVAVPYLWLALTGLPVAIVAGARLTSASVPRIETAVLAVLLAMSTALAAWPGLLRINAYTDSDGPSRHAYTLDAEGMLQPAESGLPAIRRPIDAEFWQAQATGSRWELELRRGMLGFWQYNSRPLIETIRSHYRNEK